MQLQQASQKVSASDWAGAASLLEAVIGSSVFDSLSVERRHAILTSASGVALQQEEFKRARNYSVRACSMPNPTVIDWQVRLYSSFSLPDMSDAAIALTQIARGWPKEITEVKDNLIFRILRESKKLAPSAARSYELMAALYAANWKIDGYLEPSSVWRDYALALLERGQSGEAKKVTLRVTQPGILISMRVDRRFDVIVKSSPDQFNIDKAVDSNIARLHAIVVQSPRSLQNVVELTYALLKARHYDEVLTLTDVVTQKASDSSSGKSAYDDVKDNLIWVLNNRAIALGGLGRRDEELELLIRAARRPEHGEPNVSQAINLGDFYCELGRPKEALFAIVDVQDTSPYGQQQVEAVRLCAAVQLNDSDAKVAALKYLKEHQADSPGTYQNALVEIEDLDGAAMLIMERLKNPALRSDVLAEIQNYSDPQDLPWTVKSRARFHAVLTRVDVRQAIVKVGRIESFNLRSDLP